MNIQQIGPDRLRVALDPSDLDKYDLDYFSISKESPGTKRLLKEILAQAQKTGFSAYRCKILIEVLPGKNSGCILYLTKTPYSILQEKPAAIKQNHDTSANTFCAVPALKTQLKRLSGSKIIPTFP